MIDETKIVVSAILDRDAHAELKTIARRRHISISGMIAVLVDRLIAEDRPPTRRKAKSGGADV